MAKPLVEVAISADGSVFVREVNKAGDASDKFGSSVKGAGDKAKQSQRDVDTFGESAARAAKGLAAAGAAAVIGAGYFVKSAIDQADAAGILSGKLGITTEALTKLEYAAKLSDVSQQALEGGLKKLAVTLTTAQDPASKAAKALESLGLSAQEIIRLPADQQLGKIGDALNLVDNASQRAALSQKIFGKAGVDLLPILSEGSAGIRRLGDEATRLGVVISGDTARNAQLFNDQLDTLKAAAQGVGLSVATELLPELNSMSGQLIELAQEKETSEGIAAFVRGIGEAVIWTARAIAATGNAFHDLGESIAAAFSGPAIGDLERLKGSLKDYQGQLDVYQAKVNRGIGLSQQEAVEVGRLSEQINRLNGMVRISVDIDKDHAKSQQAVAAAQAKNNELSEIDLATLPRRRVSIEQVSGALNGNAAATKAAADAEANRQKKIADGLDQARFEVEQLARTQREQRISIELRKLGASAASAEGKAIAQLTGVLFDSEQSMKANKAALDEMDRGMADLESGMAKVEKAADPWAEALTGAVERIDKAFADMWTGALTSFDDFADNLKNAFKQLLGELAHQAITRPIVMQISAAMGLGGGASSALASSGGGMGSLLSTAGSVFNGIKSGGGSGGFGGALNGAIGGSATGGSLGNALSSLRFGMADLSSKLGLDKLANNFNAQGLEIKSTGANLLDIGANIGAGFLGSLAGDKIGSALFGERKTTGIGSGVGGIAGSAFGPVGTFIGSALGSIAENAIGKIFGLGDQAKWGKLGVTTGANPTDGSGVRTVIADSGLSLTAVAKRTDAQSASDLLDAFVALDAGLSTVARGLGVTVDFAGKILGNTSLNVGNEGAKDSFGVGDRLDKFSTDKIKTSAADFVRAWIAEVSDDLPARVKKYVDQYAQLDATAEQMVQAFGFIGQIDQLLNLDVVAATTRTAESATDSLLTSYAKATTEVLRLADAYDGSLGSLENLTNGLMQQKQAAALLASAYAELSGLVESTLGGTAASLRESLLSETELYNLRRTQIDEAVSALAGASDPQAIAQLVTQIDALVQSAYGLANSDNKAAVANELIAILDGASTVAGEKITTELEKLKNSETSIVDAIDTELLATAATTQSAASNQQVDAANLQFQAANLNIQAAGQIASFAGALPALLTSVTNLSGQVASAVSSSASTSAAAINNLAAALAAIDASARLDRAKP